MPPTEEGSLSRALVLNAFQSIKDATDDILFKHNMGTYYEEYLPRSDELTIAIVSQAFEILGCKVQSSAPGTRLAPVEFPPSHAKLINWIYNVLEQKAGLIEIKGKDKNEIVRTSVPCPSHDVETLLEDLLDDRPGQSFELQIIEIIGPAYADSISGKTDAVKLLFGNDHGRALLSDFYAKSDLFSTVLDQLALFLEKIGGTWPKENGPLRILEVGAGTGGTTWKMLAVLKRLGTPFLYTMTDIGSAFGAAAQAKLAQYPTAEFKVLDIEKEPEAELHHSQHIVFGSNVFHATRDLNVSMAHVHKLLRPDGFVVLHELTMQMLWGDMSFGLFPGWWAFEDGRSNAIQSAQEWAKVLRSVGFGHVDWTDGQRPEAKVQALILAMTSN
jgi:SAM-dependent methyltransferase